MDAYHGPLVNRQLGDIFGGVLGVGDDDNDGGSPPLITGLPGLPLSIPDPFSTSRSATSSGSSSATQTATSSSAAVTSSSSASASSATSSTASSSSSATSSSSSSSSSDPTSATSSLPSNTSAVQDPVQTPPPSNDQADGRQPTATVTSFTDASQSSAASTGSAAPIGFMQNKPLSISVITIASIVGLILLTIIGTWALRRRRREKLHRLAAELSSDDLMNNRRSFDDVEKGSGSGHSGYGGSAYGGTVDVLEKMEAVGGARHDGHGGPAMPPNVRRSPTERSPNGSLAYAQTAYAQPAYAAPAYTVPVPSAYPAYGAPRPDVVSPPPPAGYYYDARDYRSSQAGAPAVPNMNRMSGGGFLPNPFQNGDNGQGFGQLYDLAYTQQPLPVPEPVAEVRTVTRKAPPRTLTVDVAAAAAPSAEPVSAASLNAPPMQVVSSENPANPPAESPRSVSGEPRRHSSLLDKSTAPTTPKTPTGSDEGHDARKRRLSHSRALDPDMPAPPVAPPLPEEFGTRADTPPGTKAPRQLKVVNA